MWITFVGGGGYSSSVLDLGGMGKCSALFSSYRTDKSL